MVLHVNTQRQKFSGRTASFSQLTSFVLVSLFATRSKAVTLSYWMEIGDPTFDYVIIGGTHIDE